MYVTNSFIETFALFRPSMITMLSCTEKDNVGSNSYRFTWSSSHELNYENFEIKLHDDDYEVFVFSDEKDKREILSNFQKMITDPDEEINFHLRAKIIIKPFIISTGNRR